MATTLSDAVFAPHSLLPDFEGEHAGDAPPPPGPVSWSEGARGRSPDVYTAGQDYEEGPKGAGGRHDGWESPMTQSPSASPRGTSAAIFYQQEPSTGSIGAPARTASAYKDIAHPPPMREPQASRGADSGAGARASPTRAVEDDVKRLTMLVESLQQSLLASESRAGSRREKSADAGAATGRRPPSNYASVSTSAPWASATPTAASSSPAHDPLPDHRGLAPARRKTSRQSSQPPRTMTPPDRSLGGLPRPAHARTATPRSGTPTTPRGRRSFHEKMKRESPFGPSPAEADAGPGRRISQKEFAAMKRGHRTPLKRHESPGREPHDTRHDPDPAGPLRVAKARVGYAGMHNESPLRGSYQHGEVLRTNKEGVTSGTGRKAGAFSPNDARAGVTPAGRVGEFDVDRLQEDKARARACRPFTSRREFEKAKKNHVLVIDSPARRKAHEVAKEDTMQTPYVSNMSPERRAKPKQVWPASLPPDAQSIMQGSWLSTTAPQKHFEVVGDRVYEDGTLLKHEMKISSKIDNTLAVQIADMFVNRLHHDEVAWDNGDTWERYHPNSPHYDAYAQVQQAREQRAREKRQQLSPEPHRDDESPASFLPRASASPRQPRHSAPSPPKDFAARPMDHHDANPVFTDPNSSHGVLAPAPSNVQAFGLDNPCPPDVADPRQRALDALQARESHPGGEATCGQCSSSLAPGQATPYCPITGELHRFHTPHNSAGRCPGGHRLVLQSNYLGNVQCSTCELVLPASRFAGCRICDYDVCDTCLGCSGEPVEVTLVRSANMGTGAICGPDMLLEEVLPDTPASACGMSHLLGRRLTHINSIPVDTIHEACDIAQDAEAVVMRFV